MAQETDTARWDLKVWAGTIDQLTRAAALAAQRVADAAPYPSDYNPDAASYDAEKDAMWRGAESARRVEIVVIEDGGFNRSLTAIDDLIDIPDDHLDRVGVIGLEIGGKGYLPPSVSITVSRRDGLETRVCGRNRTWTAGLRHELQDLLEPSERLRPRGFTNTEVVSGVALGSIAPLWLGFGLLFKYATESVVGLRVGLSLAIALLLAGSVAFLASRLPAMELLVSSQRPTYQRWRSRILAATVALVLGVAGSLMLRQSRTKAVTRRKRPGSTQNEASVELMIQVSRAFPKVLFEVPFRANPSQPERIEAQQTSHVAPVITPTHRFEPSIAHRRKARCYGDSEVLQGSRGPAVVPRVGVEGVIRSARRGVGVMGGVGADASCGRLTLLPWRTAPRK